MSLHISVAHNASIYRAEDTGNVARPHRW